MQGVMEINIFKLYYGMLTLCKTNRRYSYSPTALGQETSQHDCEVKAGTFLAKTQTNIG